MATEDNGTIKLKQLYLLAGFYTKSGGVKKGTLEPVGDTLLVLKDQVSLEVAKTEAIQDVKKKQTELKLSAYLTDSVGGLVNFSSGLFVENDKDLEKQLFTYGTSIELPEGNATKSISAFCPPTQLINYSLASHGYKNWLDQFKSTAEDLIKASKKVPAEVELDIVSVNVAGNFREANSNDPRALSEWKEDNKNNTIRAIVLPKIRAFMVYFSDERYIESKVKVTDLDGNAVFYSNVSGSKQEAEVQEFSLDKNGSGYSYAAIFYDLDHTYKDDGLNTYCFHIKPAVRKLKLESDDNAYRIVERLRFPIKNMAGEFDVINGDAFSLEESLVRQFPLRYPHVLKNISAIQDKPSPIKGLESLSHAVHANSDKIKLAGQVVTSDSANKMLRTLGLGLYNGIGERDGELKNLRSAVNMAFQVYDFAGSVKDAREKFAKLGLNDLAQVKNSLSKVGLLDEVLGNRKAKDVWDASVVDKIEDVAEKAKPAMVTKLFKRTQRAVGVALKLAELNQYKNDVLGPVMAYGSLMNAEKDTASVFKDYASKVHFLDLELVEDQNQIKKDQLEKGRDALERFQKNDKNRKQVTQVGSAKFINVTFAFDKAGFVKDDSFSDLVELLNTLESGFQLILSGHTCDIGKADYNHRLSKRRAESVKEKLLKAGLKDHIDVVIKPFGESRPVVPNTSEDNRSKNRRVDALIIYRPVGSFRPSREGIEALEKFRALEDVKRAEVGEKAQKALISTLDLIAGMPPVGPHHLTFSLIWEAAGLLHTGVDLLFDTIYGETFFSTLGDFDQYDSLSTANQIAILDKSKVLDKIPAADYLQAQMRLRAEAITGLMQLLLRCSIETDSMSRRILFDVDNAFDVRDSYTYEDNLKHYQVEEYVKEYLFSDGWTMFTDRLPVSLDEFWLYKLKAGLVKDDKADKDQKDALDKAADIAINLLSYADLRKDALIGAVGDLQLSASFVLNNSLSKLDMERDYLLTARFQEMFPIHHINSKNFSSLALAAKPDFADLNNDIYLGAMHSVRKGGSDKGASEGWSSMKDWLSGEGKGWVSPLDEIRVCVLLDPDDPVVSKYISDKIVNYIPYKLYPARIDGFSNIYGPDNEGFIRRLSLSDLTKDEREVLLNGVDEEQVKDRLYGFICNPFFMFGEKKIHGTKPMAGSLSAWLNVSPEHELRDVFGWGQKWTMMYRYEFILGYNSDTHHRIACTRKVGAGRRQRLSKVSSFPLAIVDDGSSLSRYKGEADLLDRHFLNVGKEKESLPELFVKPKAFCLFNENRNASARYHLSNENWYENKKLPSNSKLDRYSLARGSSLTLPSFNWKNEVEIILLVVSESLKKEAFDKRLLESDSIPAVVQLLREDVAGLERLGGDVDKTDIYAAQFEQDENKYLGPKYETVLTPIGQITDANGGEFDWVNEDIKDDFVDLHADLKRPESLKVLASGDVGSNKPVYAARIVLDYQNILGEFRNGLKPFAVSPFRNVFGLDNFTWQFSVRVSSQGDSGLRDTLAIGSYELPFPTDLEDKNSHWYKAEKDLIKEAENANSVNKANAKKYPDGSRPDIHTITPLMKWLLEDTNGAEFSDEQENSIESWLLKGSSRRLLSPGSPKVLEP